jgi:PST family polysaccharide transporter
VAQQVVMTTAAAAVLWAMSPVRPRLRFSARHFRDLIGFGSKSVAVRVLGSLDRQLYILLVGTYLGAAAAGHLSLAFRAVQMLHDVVAGAAQQLALPLFRRRRGDAEGLRRAHAEAVAFTCALGFPAFAGLAACAPEVVLLGFGARWAEAIPHVAALALLMLTSFPRLYSWALMASLDAPLLPLVPVLASLAALVVGMPLIGSMSLAAAMGVWIGRRFLMLAADVWALRRVSGLAPRAQFAGVAAPLLATAAMLFVLAAARAWPYAGLDAPVRLVALVATGVAVYLAAMLVLDRALLLRLAEFARAGLPRAPSAGAG